MYSLIKHIPIIKNAEHWIENININIHSKTLIFNVGMCFPQYSYKVSDSF